MATANQPEGSELSWLGRIFGHKPDPLEVAEREAIMADAHTKISEVAKLREDVLEGRNFPIASFLQGRNYNTRPFQAPKREIK